MNCLTTRRIGVAVLIAACMAMSVPAVSAAETIRIGAILALSGNAAASGQSIRDGLLLAVEEVNKRGGVNGSKIEMSIEDSQGDLRVAVEVFKKMELTRPPLFYLSFLSSVGVALGPLTDEKKAVLVGLATSAPAFTLGRELVYQYWPTVQADIPPLIRMLQDLRAKKLGIIYSNEDFGIAEQKLASVACAAAGIAVSVQPFETADTDFHRQVEAIKSSEAIFVAAVGTSLTSIIRQLREASFGGPILTPPSGANPALFVLPEMQGVYLVAPIIYNPGYLFARDAAEKYTARYQKPFNHWAASGYDFIKLISGLLEDRPASRQSVREALAAGFEYSGVFGPVRVKPGEHVIAFPMYPAQILNDTLKFR
jgi:branched-chain amino acid transport system substrate-binding protein